MNSTSPVQPQPTRRRKGSIEIYFVLYLSSIILLLGTTPSGQNSHEEELEDVIRHLLVSDFKVRTEKAALLYNFIPAGVQLDTAGVYLRRDSLNVVTAQGTFSSVEFKIVAIADSASGQPLPAERATLVRRSERSAIFQWRPLSSDRNGVYRVTVAGIATPLPRTDLPPHLREKVAEILRRKGTVSDSVTFTVNVFAVNDQAMLRRVVEQQIRVARADTPIIASGPEVPLLPGATPSELNGLGGPAFELAVQTPVLPVAPGKTWRNRINIAGAATMADLDLTASGGDAAIVQRTPTWIEVGGTAPASGQQQVTISGTRRSDRRPVTAFFTVRATAMPAVPVPPTMLVGQSYNLDFTAPGIPSERIAVEVRENGNVVIARAEARSVLNYRPAESGKVRFIRYLDDQIVDDAEADLRPLPPPEVMKPQQPRTGAGEVTITTVSYGMVNGVPNRAVLKVKSGNADDPEHLEMQFDEKNKRVTQTWRVRKKDKGDEFVFTVYAIDQRGSRSGKSNEVGLAFQ